ncbi:hypothetical protein V8C35DRAFT_277736 [Trichoderma chlorosporum]
MTRHRMRLRSSAKRKTPAWISLPPEIRRMILEAIANQKAPGWASLASVCREWQYVLEKANFYKIKLRPARLDDFKSIIPPQKRNLIHHICLTVELPHYRPLCCSIRPPLQDGYTSIVSEAICTLFSILSAWEPAEHLALEINVYSLSDNKHCIKNIYLSSDTAEVGEDAMPDDWKAPLHHDPGHGWVKGQHVRPPARRDIKLLFTPIWLHFKSELPKVEAVTSFIIRRQFRRNFAPDSFRLILSKLPRLEHLSYEMWDQFQYYGGVVTMIYDSNTVCQLPETISSIIIFQDSYKFYNLFPDPPAPPIPSDILNVPYAEDQAGKKVLTKSLNLHRLAVSFRASAENIFRRCPPSWIWPNLQSMALTSPLLQKDDETAAKLDVLLCRAAVVVRQMPKIHTFVLWNGGNGHACAFIYRIDGDYGSLTWRGTWLLELSRRVVKAWQITDSKLHPSRSELCIKQEKIQAMIKSHGDAIYYLKLPCQVIDPASLWQIRREARSAQK